MSRKAKKQVVSTQCLTHLISLEICIPKSLVVWSITTASHLSQHACKILRHIYSLEGHVLWLAKDSAGIKHHVKVEYMYI